MTMAYPNFLSSSVANTVILYGQVSDPARLWEVMNTDIESLEPLTSQHTVIKQNQDVIRLSSPGWMDFTFNERMTLTKSSDLYLLCREKIMRGVSNFDLPLRRFLETYLDFVWAQTENLQDEHRSSGAGSTLFSSEDWSFSGWLPCLKHMFFSPRHLMRAEHSLQKSTLLFGVAIASSPCALRGWLPRYLQNDKSETTCLTTIPR